MTRSRPRRRRRALAWLALPTLLAVSLTTGCGPRNFLNENDKLRAERLELQRQLEQLNTQVENLMAEKAALRQRFETAPAPLPDAEAPTLSRVRFGRYSGPVDDDGDGRDDRVRVYLQTLDQHGRMMPAAGRATLQAVVIPDEKPPYVLAQRAFDPPEFEDAFRSGFTGTHYTLELPLPEGVPDDVKQVTVKLTFVEHLTGVELSAEEPMLITR